MKSAEQGLVMAIKCVQDLDEHERRITPSFIPKPFECAACYMYHPHDPPEHELRPCKRCHRVYYCGKESQVKHCWKMERRRCAARIKVNTKKYFFKMINSFINVHVLIPTGWRDSNSPMGDGLSTINGFSQNLSPCYDD